MATFVVRSWFVRVRSGAQSGRRSGSMMRIARTEENGSGPRAESTSWALLVRAQYGRSAVRAETCVSARVSAIKRLGAITAREGVGEGGGGRSLAHLWRKPALEPVRADAVKCTQMGGAWAPCNARKWGRVGSDTGINPSLPTRAANRKPLTQTKQRETTRRRASSPAVSSCPDPRAEDRPTARPRHWTRVQAGTVRKSDYRARHLFVNLQVRAGSRPGAGEVSSRPAVFAIRLAQLPRPRSNRWELRAESPSPRVFTARVRQRRSVAPKPNVPEWLRYEANPLGRDGAVTIWTRAGSRSVASPTTLRCRFETDPRPAHR